MFIFQKLQIGIEGQCTCPCEVDKKYGFVQDSPYCSSNGNLTCGICKCALGYTGLNCECDVEESQSEDDPQ